MTCGLTKSAPTTCVGDDFSWSKSLENRHGRKTLERAGARRRSVVFELGGERFYPEREACERQRPIRIRVPHTERILPCVQINQ